MVRMKLIWCALITLKCSEELVGEQGQGWNIAKFLLAHERSGIAGIASLKRELST